MLVNVSMTMVIAPITFLWDGHWHDPSTVPGGRSLLIVDLLLASCWPCVGHIMALRWPHQCLYCVIYPKQFVLHRNFAAVSFSNR